MPGMLNKMIRKVWICLVECGNDGSEKQMNRNSLDLNDSKYENVTVLSEFLSVVNENENLLRHCDVDELGTTYLNQEISQSTAINEFCGSSEEDPLYIYFPKNYETTTDYVTKKEHDELNAKFEALKEDFLNSQKIDWKDICHCIWDYCRSGMHGCKRR